MCIFETKIALLWASPVFQIINDDNISVLILVIVYQIFSFDRENLTERSHFPFLKIVSWSIYCYGIKEKMKLEAHER